MMEKKQEYVIIVNATSQVSPDDWATTNSVLKVDEGSNFKDILEWIDKIRYPNRVTIEKCDSLKVNSQTKGE